MEPYILESLKKSRLFQNFTVDMILNLVPKLNVRFEKYTKNEIVFEDKHKVDLLGVVIVGELCAATIDFNGQENLLQKMYSSYTIGAEIACTKTQMSPYVLYCVKETEIFFFPYKMIYEQGFISEKERGLLLQNLLDFMGYINHKRLLKSYILSTKSAKERIMRYLLEQSKIKGSKQFTISYDREQLANYLCLNRSVLSHELSILRKDGILEFYKNKFTIK